MRARLMFADRDVEAGSEERGGAPDPGDLVSDLDLGTVWAAAAGEDAAVRDAVRTAMLEPLTDPARIDYRNDALADCLAHPDVVRQLYRLAVEAIADERRIHRASFFGKSSEAQLNRSVTALRAFLDVLRRMRELAEDQRAAFGSAAFTRFFGALVTELDDGFVAEVEEHLRVLRFRDGVVASARLGRHNQGVDYQLRVPRSDNRSRLLPRRPPLARPHYSRTIPPDDLSADQDLAGLRTRMLTLAADSVARAAEHVLAFFAALRSELAFYVGCLNLTDRLADRGLPTCRPVPHPAGTGVLRADGLHDPGLALHTADAIRGNDLEASGRRLIVVTGANQGGKSTFLRSVGLAQLLMQAGMPVPARSFEAAVVTGVFTHFPRGEDDAMSVGKFDEELRRMSRIARRIRRGGLLLCNESLAATNEREAAEIGADMLRAFGQAGIAVVFVTHNFELARRFLREHADTTLFLRAERESDGTRSHRLREAAPLPTSYAGDLYRRTFAAPADE